MQQLIIIIIIKEQIKVT